MYALITQMAWLINSLLSKKNDCKGNKIAMFLIWTETSLNKQLIFTVNF